MPVFKNTVAPMLKSGAKAVAREALKTGVGVAGDLLDGESARHSLEQRLPRAGRSLAKRGVNKIQSMLDGPPKKKRAVKKRRKTIKGHRLFNY